MTSRADEQVKLYHFPPSLCSQKVRLALCEKGVAWQGQLVNIGPPMENYAPWYARINPRMVVPTLVHGDRVVTDSARIVRYIDDSFEGPPLWRAEAADAARVAALVELQDGLNIREIAYAPRGGLIGMLTKGAIDKRRVVLTHNRDQHPELAELYQARLDDVAAWREVSHNPAKVEREVARVREAMTDVAQGLKQHRFAAGEAYTMADVVWTVILARSIFMGYRVWWTGELAPLEDYYRRMRERPSFALADVWERFKPWTMLPVIGQVVLHRLGIGRRSVPLF